MKLKYQFLINQIGDNFVAVPAGNGVVEFNGVLQINEDAAFIIELLNDEISYDEILNKIVEKYDCNLETAKKNVDTIISDLKGNGLLVE